jgi:radical SAM superfamily enzyme YgiQ (UPF0313 family)
MKTILLAINSKYIHTLLAPRYLKANCGVGAVEILESNINVSRFNVLSQLYLKKPDVIAISCYIFNIDYIDRLLPEIRLLLPQTKIILGGYEAAFDTGKYLDLCDYIVKGEGDLVFGKLLESICKNTPQFPKIIDAGTVKNLDETASPYTGEYCSLGKNKILYYESSRGCPFACSYCMSANTRGVRAFSLERVFSDLNNIMRHTPKQIKFVDRTFNYDVKRAAAILEYIMENFSQGGTNFHFEIAPQLFDERLFAILAKAPKGLLQFEVGVQSYNKDALKSIKRNADAETVDNNLKRLISLGNIHIHADLIAGLPEESLQSFIKGFNRLFNLKPHHLQLGFLKVLKGSELFYNRQGTVTFGTPPYEVAFTPDLSFDDILKLKTAEEMLEIYYNSNRFPSAVNFLVPDYFSPFEFLLRLGEYYYKTYPERQNISQHAQCGLLFDFAAENISVENKKDFLAKLVDLINADYLSSGNIRKWRRSCNRGQGKRSIYN